MLRHGLVPECTVHSKVSSRATFGVVVLSILGIPSPEPVHASLHEFSMTADGACAGTPSLATGTGTFTLDTDTGEVAYEIALTGLTPTAMHVHAPADDCPIASVAPALIFFPSGTDISGTYALEPLLQDLMLAGKHWINVHTDAWTNGEIRGRIIPLCPNDCSGHGVCELGVCVCDSAWMGADCSVERVIPAVSDWGLIVTAMLLLTAASVIIAESVRSRHDARGPARE